jgi:ATP-dependent helicase/nuclease subunit A
MLKAYAIQYEETSYKGLFNFIRYIEKLKKYDVDMEVASDTNENDDVVRIMTIHKSKGLQFPIVFISNLANGFNEGDTRGEIVLEQKLGIGLKMKNPQRLIKADTMIKTAIARKKKNALRGEELRVLYVAMTRPEEKLIMTYAYKWEKKEDKDTKVDMLKEWHSINGLTTEQIDSQTLNSTKCLGDFVSMSLARHPGMKTVKSDFTWEVKLDNAMYRYGVLDENTKVDFDIIDAGDSENGYDISEKAYERIYLKNPTMEEVQKGHSETDNVQDTMKKILHENFSYVYPYKENMDIKSKISVSEIKQKYIGEIDPETEERFAQQPIYPVIPAFAGKEEKGLATNRGTAIHRVFELFDYTIQPDTNSISQMIKSLLEEGLIDEETANLAKPHIFLAFMQTDLYKHMKKAAELGKLKREQQFIVGFPANQVYKGNKSEELVLVQGIIDAYYEEEGRIVIVDYKTDNVESPEKLESIYRAQLQIYKMALAKISDNNNIDMVLYSTKFNMAIAVKKESVFEE